MFNAGSSTPDNAKGTYSVIADAVRRIASENHLAPNQAQAIIWTHWQTLPGATPEAPNGHKGYREDFAPIAGDAGLKSDRVKAKKKAAKLHAAVRAKENQK
jgi:hypothetical protein